MTWPEKAELCSLPLLQQVSAANPPIPAAWRALLAAAAGRPPAPWQRDSVGVPQTAHGSLTDKRMTAMTVTESARGSVRNDLPAEITTAKRRRSRIQRLNDPRH